MKILVLALLKIQLLGALTCMAASIQQQQDLSSSSGDPFDRNQQLAAATSIEINANDSTSSFHISPVSRSSSSLIRVNVSNVCEKNHMKVSIRLNRPFYGLIHAKDKRKKSPCYVEGGGEQFYTFDVSFTLVPSDPAYCGMTLHAAPAWHSNQSILHQANSAVETLSLALVVRLHKSIEFSDDRYFLLSCPNPANHLLSRCSRSDCSLAPAQGDDRNRGFVASDSILAPVFRPTNERAQLSRQMAVEDSAQQHKCDLMVDLKFQWLVKLCWILIGLIALMFCVIFYLCVAPSSDSNSNSNSNSKKRRSRKSSSKNRRERRSSTMAERQVAAASMRKSTSLDQSAKSSSAGGPDTGAESLATTTELGANWPPVASERRDYMDKMRENNQYLASKQHLLLTDFLAAKSAMEEYEQQQQGGQRFASSLARRRSIGGSAAMLNCLPAGTETLPSTLHQQRSDQLNGARLDPKHRLKSKSQTTIYYEQNQDPFKAVPFQFGPYVTDYQDDGMRHNRDTYSMGGRPTDLNGNYARDDSTNWSYEPQSMPMMAHDFQQWPPTNKSQHTTGTTCADEAPPLPPIRQQLSGREEHLTNSGGSQFDPQNQSLQLIELIQSKHREQLAQADRTAAGIRSAHQHEPPTKPLPKPILTNQRQQTMINRANQQQWR